MGMNKSLQKTKKLTDPLNLVDKYTFFCTRLLSMIKQLGVLGCHAREVFRAITSESTQEAVNTSKA